MSEEQTFDSDGFYEEDEEVLETKADPQTGAQNVYFSVKDIKHPIFSLSGDPIISFFTNLRKSKYKVDGNFMQNTKLVEVFATLIFDGKNPSQLKKFYDKKNLTFNSMCSCVIPLGEAFYMCLDCDKLRKNDSTLVSCLCRNCFIDSNHVGHRVLMSPNKYGSTSVCDCGNTAAIEGIGFCEVHTQKTVTIEEIIQVIGPNIAERFINVMSKTFYGIFALMEVDYDLIEKGKKVKSYEMEKLLNNIMVLFNFVFAEVLTFWKALIDVNGGFIPLIAHFMQTKLTKGFNVLMHNCSEHKKTIYTGIPTECSCTIGELIIKNISLVFPDFEAKITTLFNELFKFEDFRSYFTKIFIENIYFLVFQNVTGMRLVAGAYSNLMDCDTNFFADEKYCSEVAKTPAMENLFSLFYDMINDFTAPSAELNSLYAKIASFFELMLRPNSEGCHFLLSKNIAGTFLGILVNCGYKFPFDGPIFSDMLVQDLRVSVPLINLNIRIEQNLQSIFKRIIVQFGELNEEAKKIAYSKIVEDWKNLFAVEEKEREVITFRPVLERVASFLILDSDLSISKEKVRNFLENMSSENIAKNAENLLKRTLIQVGALRRIILIDPNTRREIGIYYYQDEFGTFEGDSVAMQMLIPFLDSSNCFEYLVKNWFSYSSDINEFILEAKAINLAKSDAIALEDFLNALVFTMIDETCLLKLKLTKDPRNYNEELDFANELKKVTEKLLLSFLASTARIPIHLTFVNAHMKNFLWESNIEDFLPNFATKDEIKSTVKVKEEYLDELDPFCFAPKSHLYKEIYNRLHGNIQRKEKVDAISGKYYTDLPYYCYEAQKVLFESELPGFLARTVREVEKDSAEILLRPVLRLIIMHLQCVSHFEKIEIGTESLLKRIEVYKSAEFRNGLEKIKQREELIDYHLAVEKVEGLLKKFSGEEEGKIQEENKEEKEEHSPETQKKKLAEQKQKEMKEEFLNKQKAFLNKQADILNRLDEEVKKEEDELVCNSCKHAINVKEEEYGTPCYINFVNSLSQNILKISNQEGEIFPVLQGCGHIFHLKCFNHWKNNTQQQIHAFQNVLNTFETYCPLCKALANIFILDNQKREKIENKEISTKAQSMLWKFTELAHDITNRHEKITVINPEKRSKPEIMQGIYSLMNMYWGYLENLNLDSPNSLTKQFKFYADFLVSIKASTQIFQKEIEEFINEEPQEEDFVTLDKIFITKVIYEIMKSETNPKEKILEIIVGYLGSKFEEAFLFQMLLGKQPKGTKSELVISALKEGKDKEVLLSELTVIFQKALVLLALVDYQYEVEAKCFNTLEIIYNADENLEQYIQYFGVSNLTDLLNKALETKDFMSVKQRQNIQKSILGVKENADLSARFVLNSKLVPFKFDFPANYQEFIDKYMNYSCALCDTMPKHGEKFICLLCGEVICKGTCTKKGKKLIMGTGNIHCIDHCGYGIYLEVFYLRIVLINLPKNSILLNKYIYTDDSGQFIGNLILNPYDKRLDSIDFKRFKLNQETVKFIESTVRGLRVPQEFFKNIGENRIIVDDGAL